MTTILSRTAWIAVAALMAVLLCHEWYSPDIWYHLALGDRIARSGLAQPPDPARIRQPDFINIYWLFQVTLRGVYSLGGVVAVNLGFLLLWAAAAATWIRTSGLARARGWGPWCALAAAILCAIRFEERPEVLSFAFLALQVRWLAQWNDEGRPSFWAYARFALVQAAWSNVHGYFILGPALVGLKLASVYAEGLQRAGPQTTPAQTAPLWRLLALVMAASVLSPFGWHTWECAFYQLKLLRAMRGTIQEFLPPYRLFAALWTVRAFAACWIGVAAGVIVIVKRPGRSQGRVFALLAAGTGLCLSVATYRNIPLLVFFAGPLIAALVGTGPAAGTKATPRFAAGIFSERAAYAGAAAAAFGLIIWVAQGGYYRSLGGVSSFAVRISQWAYPTRFADYLRASGFRGSIFNDPADGGYLEFHARDVSIYGDSRFTDPAPVWEYFLADRFPASFRKLDARCHFDGALLRLDNSAELIEALDRDPFWRLVYADLYRVFFITLRAQPTVAGFTRSVQRYQGEDLSRPKSAFAAVQWIRILLRENDRTSLLEALRQFSAAREVPGALVDYAQGYADRYGDSEVSGVAHALALKRSPADR